MNLKQARNNTIKFEKTEQNDRDSPRLQKLIKCKDEIYKDRPS